MTIAAGDAINGDSNLSIQVADSTLLFRRVVVADRTLTGDQLAVAGGFRSADAVSVLRFLPNGDLEDIRPVETVDLRHGESRFVIVATDRSYRLTLNGQRFDWPCRVISAAVLRRLGDVPSDEDIFERQEQRDRRFNDSDLIDLDKAGVESFASQKRVWRLNVQGVLLELNTPTVVVRDALQRAGINPDEGWQIFLKFAGSAPKERVELSTEVDLTRRGIEKLRLTPQEVNNGKEPSEPRREFDLLEVDETHLNRLGLKWETFTEVQRRWLLLQDYPLPSGYSTRFTLLALEIPPNYPAAQLYGFYMPPSLVLASARTIDSTQMRGVVNGVEFHGWSRNRGPSAPWNPASDNLITQLALVDAALAKEVGE